MTSNPDLVDDLQAVWTALTRGDAADLQAARERLAARGIQVDPVLEHLRGLRELSPSDLQHTLASSLRALASAIEPEEGPAAEQIDRLVARLERQIGPLIGQDPERTQRERQAEYRRAAQNSIADALREAGITPLAGTGTQPEPPAA